MVLLMTGDNACFANGVDDERKLMVLLIVLIMTGDCGCFANGVDDNRRS